MQRQNASGSLKMRPVFSFLQARFGNTPVSRRRLRRGISRIDLCANGCATDNQLEFLALNLTRLSPIMSERFSFGPEDCRGDAVDSSGREQNTVGGHSGEANNLRGRWGIEQMFRFAQQDSRKARLRSEFKTSVARASGLRVGQFSLGRRQRDARATLLKAGFEMSSRNTHGPLLIQEKTARRKSRGVNNT
jgi:hypothetical protein